LSPENNGPTDESGKGILLDPDLLAQDTYGHGTLLAAPIVNELPSDDRNSPKNAESSSGERPTSDQVATWPASEPSTILEQIAVHAPVYKDTELRLNKAGVPASGNRAVINAATKKDHASADSVPAMDRTHTRNRPPRVVVAKEGDNLYRLILRRYGRYDSDILRQVLQENPRITNPDWILVGQAIRLPISTEGAEFANQTI
jgi:hypothetical protein